MWQTARELFFQKFKKCLAIYDENSGCEKVSLDVKVAKCILENLKRRNDIMIMSDQTIIKMLKEKTLIIEPLEKEQIQPASVDIRLGNTFSVVEDLSTGIINLEQEIKYKTIKSDTYILLPNQFVLATTMEYFDLPNDLTAFVEGRSSLGRMGLFIQNAGWVDPGFKGEITLELYNANRCAIELKAGRRVGQLVFAKMDKTALNPYNGKYQGQKGATGPKVFLDFEIK